MGPGLDLFDCFRFGRQPIDLCVVEGEKTTSREYIVNIEGVANLGMFGHAMKAETPTDGEGVVLVEWGQSDGLDLHERNAEPLVCVMNVEQYDCFVRYLFQHKKNKNK